ncbi:MAG: phage DNA encapsidation protein, partial [Clostridia bacterium]|nr:phage DNA encapsidation protein [Clostridia bacterium]
MKEAQANRKHYGDNDGLCVLSYNGVITEVNTNRTYGKTWTFKKRAFRRAIKHHKKTIWLRVFKGEAKQAQNEFYTSRDLQKFCGISIYDKEGNPTGNVKQNGNTFYYRTDTKHKWQWFLKVFALSDVGTLRGFDDVDIDTIVFDEYAKTQVQLNRYHGNFVNDFLDIFFSIKREHKVRCILLGNKEIATNPFNAYFGIKPLPTKYEGIRTYRNGSFVIQQINNEVIETNEFDRQVKDLLNSTSYGGFIYESEYKNAQHFKKRKTPATASVYCQLYFNGLPFKISVDNGYFYVNNKIDNTRRVYCDTLHHKYKNELMLVKRQKRFFTGLIDAVADNRVYYDNAGTYGKTEYRFPFII